MNRELLYLEWIDEEIKKSRNALDNHNNSEGWINTVMISIEKAKLDEATRCKGKFIEIMSAGHSD